MSTPKIAIIGAGPGGLTLAAILQKHTIPFTIYDLDASPHERNQGGTLDLHPQGGQLALKAAGLWDAFVRFARPESDVRKIVAQSGEVLWDGNGPDARVVEQGKEFDHRPEIDREKLKEVLLSGVEKGAIKWGMKLGSVEEIGDGVYDLHFENGQIHKGFDLVIGADGAWSKVRALLSDEKPFYSGIVGVEFWAEDADVKHPFVAEFVGAGSMFSFGEGKAVMAQRLGSGTIRTYGMVKERQGFFEECGIDWEGKEKARREFVERYFGDCAGTLQRLMVDSDDQLVARTLYMLPVGYRWEGRKGVTLLGDAAHLMTPFAGVGVNAAMWDGLDLANGIVECVEEGKHLDMIVRDYEATMFPRGEKFAERTMKGLKGHFSAHGNDHFVKRLKEE